MNKGKKITAAVAASAVATTLVAPAAFASATFDDINNSFAKDAILELAAKGILNGKAEGKFDPTGLVTRAEFAKILVLSKGLQPKTGGAPSFNDVAASDWSFGYVEAAKEAGLINGLGGGAFGPNAQLTREQMATLFVRALGVNVAGKAANLTFADKDAIQDYAKDSVAYAVELGLINGVGDNKFAPAGNATREAVAKVAKLFIEKAQSALSGVTYVDQNTLTLNFSAEVAELKAENVKVAVKATNAAVAVKEVVLAADKKSATVKVDTLAAATTFAVTALGKSVDVTTPAEVTATASVVAANKVKVEFNQAVDKSKATAELKFGYVPQDVTAEWAADNKSVVLVSEDAFFEGDYTVSVKNAGLKVEDYALEVEAQELKSFTIKTEHVTAVLSQVLTIEAVDQYGNAFDVAPTDFTVSARNVTTGDVVTIAPGVDENEFAVTGVDAFDVEDKIVVTIAHATGLSTSKTFTVEAANAVASIELKAPAPLEDEDRIAVSQSNLVLPVTLKDQYGQEIDIADSLFAANGDITFISSNTDIVNPTSFVVDGDGNLTFDTGLEAGKVTVTAIANGSGKSVSVTFEVFDVAAIDKLALQQPTGLFVADEDIEVKYTAVDTFGENVELDTFDQGGLVWFSTKPAIVDVATDIRVEDGKLYIKPDAAAEGSVTVSAFLDGVKQGEVTLNVKKAAVATKITKLSDDALTYFSANDGEYTYTAADLVVVDQYNRVIDEAKLTGAISVSAADTEVVSSAGATLTAEGTGSKTVTVTYEVVADGPDADSNPDVVITKDFTVNVVAANTVTGYELEKIENALLFDDNDGAVAPGAYAKTITINNGVDAAGHKIALSLTDLAGVFVTTSNEAVVTVTGAVISAAATAEEGDKATVTAWKNGKKIAEIEFTVSAKAPEIKELSYNEDLLVAEITGTGTSDLGAALVAVDQYGVDITTDAILPLVNTDGIWFSSDDSIATVDALSGEVTGVDEGTVTITFVAKNGKTISQEIKVK